MKNEIRSHSSQVFNEKKITCLIYMNIKICIIAVLFVSYDNLIWYVSFFHRHNVDFFQSLVIYFKVMNRNSNEG